MAVGGCVVVLFGCVCVLGGGVLSVVGMRLVLQRPKRCHIGLVVEDLVVVSGMKVVGGSEG